MNLLTALLLFGTLVMAQDRPYTVNREQWLQNMADFLPTFFCKEDGCLRKCAPTLKAASCQEETALAIATCTTRFRKEAPDKITFPGNSEKWSSAFGSCAHTEIKEKMLAAKKWRKNSDCMATPPLSAAP